MKFIEYLQRGPPVPAGVSKRALRELKEAFDVAEGFVLGHGSSARECLRAHDRLGATALAAGFGAHPLVQDLLVALILAMNEYLIARDQHIAILARNDEPQGRPS